MALVSGLLTVVPATAAELSSLVQQQIRAATFEVVQLKPPDGEVTYDRPPLADLIALQRRNDKYRSIGTAFAIGPNRYVTVAHVIACHEPQARAAAAFLHGAAGCTVGRSR